MCIRDRGKPAAFNDNTLKSNNGVTNARNSRTCY
jgi:hypothetical protein